MFRTSGFTPDGKEVQTKREPIFPWLDQTTRDMFQWKGFQEERVPQLSEAKIAQAKGSDQDTVAEKKGSDEDYKEAQAEEKTQAQLLIEERKQLDHEWEIEAEKRREAIRQQKAEAKDGHKVGRRRNRTYKNAKKRKNRSHKNEKKRRIRRRSHR